METTIITWNFTNWITIVLMALVGFLVFGFVVGSTKKFVASRQGD